MFPLQYYGKFSQIRGINYIGDQVESPPPTFVLIQM